MRTLLALTILPSSAEFAGLKGNFTVPNGSRSTLQMVPPPPILMVVTTFFEIRAASVKRG
jgi:hypothetical protein